MEFLEDRKKEGSYKEEGEPAMPFLNQAKAREESRKEHPDKAKLEHYERRANQTAEQNAPVKEKAVGGLTQAWNFLTKPAGKGSKVLGTITGAYGLKQGSSRPLYGVPAEKKQRASGGRELPRYITRGGVRYRPVGRLSRVESEPRGRRQPSNLLGDDGIGGSPLFSSGFSGRGSPLDHLDSGFGSNPLFGGGKGRKGKKGRSDRLFWE